MLSDDSEKSSVETVVLNAMHTEAAQGRMLQYVEFEDLIIGTAIGGGNCLFDSIRQLIRSTLTVQ